MYQDLVASGSQSATAAPRVGVQIEQLDIADLQADLNTTRQQDIREVYQKLLQGIAATSTRVYRSTEVTAGCPR